MTFIPAEEYARIITQLPILCVDILVENPAGEFLLVKRANDPKKGVWWPIGGRVLFGETLADAVARKLLEEAGVKADSIAPIGVYELISTPEELEAGAAAHTVSVVYRARIGQDASVRLDDQSVDWKFSTEMPRDFIVQPLTSSEPAGRFS